MYILYFQAVSIFKLVVWLYYAASILLTTCFAAEDFPRLNHGVIFKDSEKIITLSENTFNYVFIVPFPNTSHGFVFSERESIDCSGFGAYTVSDNATRPPFFAVQCNEMQKLLDSVYNDTIKFSTSLNNTIAKIKSILPSHTVDHDDRSSRAPFSFMSDIFEILTGSPSETSFKRLNNNVRHLQMTNVHLEDSVG